MKIGICEIPLLDIPNQTQEASIWITVCDTFKHFCQTNEYNEVAVASNVTEQSGGKMDEMKGSESQPKNCIND